MSLNQIMIRQKQSVIEVQPLYFLIQRFIAKTQTWHSLNLKCVAFDFQETARHLVILSQKIYLTLSLLFVRLLGSFQLRYPDASNLLKIPADSRLLQLFSWLHQASILEPYSIFFLEIHRYFSNIASSPADNVTNLLRTA